MCDDITSFLVDFKALCSQGRVNAMTPAGGKQRPQKVTTNVVMLLITVTSPSKDKVQHKTRV